MAYLSAIQRQRSGAALLRSKGTFEVKPIRHTLFRRRGVPDEPGHALFQWRRRSPRSRRVGEVVPARCRKWIDRSTEFTRRYAPRWPRWRRMWMKPPVLPVSYGIAEARRVAEGDWTSFCKQSSSIYFLVAPHGHSSCPAAPLQAGIDACGTRGDFQRRYGPSIGTTIAGLLGRSSRPNRSRN
jgi:hypothetical protein